MVGVRRKGWWEMEMEMDGDGVLQGAWNGFGKESCEVADAI